MHVVGQGLAVQDPLHFQSPCMEGILTGDRRLKDALLQDRVVEHH